MLKITATNPEGKEINYKILAIKPLTAHPEDAHIYVILYHRPDLHTPYVVHHYNAETEATYWGDYCVTLKHALKQFNSK